MSPSLSYFNPRSYKRSDNSSPIAIFKFCIISIHAPTRGATISPPEEISPPGISIHAPTRGATLTIGRVLRGIFISIHAPTRGATWLQYWMRMLDNYFNPRSYKRSDTTLLFDNSSLIISIHAPTRGATFCTSIACPDVFYFNPRSYKRSDCSVMRKCSAPCYFNPRSYKRSEAKMHNNPYTYL